ncbi:beta-mannosidase [Alicyclobacillus kakegawensis]|uniref:beta-mannosidase n=1 Tax=Alicyclobacillus kakegawensis TaxID=392012 RepID=UPI0008354A38|nr:glycoside hydrolase family 2 protein [Alicyclobacillus kakegawensis]
MDEGAISDLVMASPDFIDHFWIPTRVPGDVHTTLIERGIIEHPFFGHNDVKARWIEDKVWWYRTELFWDEVLEPDDRVELVFEGLDTFATVYFNGLEMARSENMFVPLVLDVTREIQRGRNVIAVKFDPILYRVANKEMRYWSGFSKERIWVRKAQMNFGWDWCPRLVTVGIWKPVHLLRRRTGRLTSVWARTTKLTPDHSRAWLDVDVEAQVWADSAEQVVAEVELASDAGRLVHELPLRAGRGSLRMEIPQPRLWWTHDLGEPHLYKLQTRLYVNGEVVDEHASEVGIRTIELRTADDQGRPVFTFVLNGVPVFARGANWIPVDSFFASASDMRYQQLIRLAKEAHMNMLRVWGGGIYERDVFYQTCDREGVLVWQDFMFACALYPDYNMDFMRNVETEMRHVIRALRNHACLALWGGNNENDWLYEMLRASGTIQTPFYGERIYHQLIPKVLAELDSTRPYWPSSPYGGNDHNSAEAGDRHNWQVWHGHVYPRRFGEPERVDYSVAGVSFKHYAEDEARFVSEFGMHAAANRYTLARWLPEGTLYWGSPELAYRNKDYHHPKGNLLMAGYTGEPHNLETYLAYSMLTQAEGLRFGVEHYRRRKFETSGTLIWQLNDCWPGTSWSVIDYHLLPKASYYYARRFYHPILWSLRVIPGEVIELWGVNDTRWPVEERVRVEVRTFHGETMLEEEVSVSLPANGIRQLRRWSEAEVLRGADPRHVVVISTPIAGRGPRQIVYLRDHRELCWPSAELRWEVDHERRTVTVQTDVHARFVQIELAQSGVVCSDNFFDLPAGERTTIEIRQLEGDPLRWDTLHIHALNERGNA